MVIGLPVVCDLCDLTSLQPTEVSVSLLTGVRAGDLAPDIPVITAAAAEIVGKTFPTGLLFGVAGFLFAMEVKDVEDVMETGVEVTTVVTV